MNNPQYKVTVRGPVPAELGEKLAQAQAAAIKSKRSNKKAWPSG